MLNIVRGVKKISAWEVWMRNILSSAKATPAWEARDQVLRESAPLTVEQAFELVYGRAITSEEFHCLSKFGVGDATTDLGLLRSVVAAFDRQTYPTPLSLRCGAEQFTTIDFETFKLVLDTSDVSVGRPIMTAKEYEPHLCAFVKSVLRPKMTVVDVGANVGFYTMMFASIVGSTGKVIAFEPNSENNRLILLSLEANKFSQVQLFPFALAESAGSVFFSPMLGSNGGLMPSTSETLTHPNCTVVPCHRLDAMVTEHIDFIKIDVEGAEYRALSGGMELIKRFRPIVTTEFSMEMLPRVSRISGGDFLKWMKGFGYRIHLLTQDRSGQPEITDIDAFLAGWGDLGRIEDLAFLPT
jgi:FkbM family methyltransferase